MFGAPANSFQNWQQPGGGLTPGSRPRIEDYLTQGQISKGIRKQMGVSPIGAPPGTDIRSVADRGPGGLVPGGGGNTNFGGGLTPESTWRGIFGPKENPEDVGKPKMGMHSVMAAHQYTANLLQALGGASRGPFNENSGLVGGGSGYSY